MDTRTLRGRCEARLRDIPIPIPFDLRAFAAQANSAGDDPQAACTLHPVGAMGWARVRLGDYTAPRSCCSRD